MRTPLMRIGVAVTMAFALVQQSFSQVLPSRFDAQPIHTDVLGNAGADEFGQFQKNRGPKLFRYFLGTEETATLILDFDRPFEDGAGTDFAIVTNSELWGPLATRALFQFFLGDEFQGALIAHLRPGIVFRIELPRAGIIANRVIVTNLSPDPLGINDDATMTFDDAGVSHTIDVNPKGTTNQADPAQ
jgi:hypothetical protein